MDSRIDPLRMLGLNGRDLNTSTGWVTPQALKGTVLWVCTCSAYAGSSWCPTPAARWPRRPRPSERVGASAGADASWQSLGVVTDQVAALRDDVAKVRSHPLIPSEVPIGGFVYDVDTGLLEQQV